MFHEKFGTAHSVMQHHIPEDWSFQLHCCENLKPHNVIVLQLSPISTISVQCQCMYFQFR